MVLITSLKVRRGIDMGKCDFILENTRVTNFAWYSTLRACNEEIPLILLK